MGSASFGGGVGNATRVISKVWPQDQTRRMQSIAVMILLKWERLYVARSGEGGEVLTHKDFIVCTLRVYAIGYLQKSIGEVLVRTKPTEYRWRGGIQHKEVMSDGESFYTKSPTMKESSRKER